MHRDATQYAPTRTQCVHRHAPGGKSSVHANPQSGRVHCTRRAHGSLSAYPAHPPIHNRMYTVLCARAAYLSAAYSVWEMRSQSAPPDADHGEHPMSQSPVASGHENLSSLANSLCASCARIRDAARLCEFSTATCTAEWLFSTEYSRRGKCRRIPFFQKNF